MYTKQPTKFGLQIPDEPSEDSNSIAIFSEDGVGKTQKYRRNEPDKAELEKQRARPTDYRKKPTIFGKQIPDIIEPEPSHRPEEEDNSFYRMSSNSKPPSRARVSG